MRNNEVGNSISLPFDPALLGTPDVERSNMGQPRSKLILFWIGFMPVFILYGMVGYGYLILMIVEGLPNMLGRNIMLGVFEFVVGHAALGLFFTAYHKILMTSPGDIPHQFNDDVVEGGIDGVESTQFGERRACDKCRMFKPDRSHHCRICQRCVLKMDHHCPWVNNCVGFRNYKYFVLFLMYVPVICFLGVLFSIPTFFRIEDWTHLGAWEIQLFIVDIMCAVFGIGIFFFALLHLRMTTLNMTTIESMESSYGKNRGRRIHPYDLGSMRANFEQVFGKDPLYWFLPVYTSIGDGCSFPLHPKAEAELEERRKQEELGYGARESSPSG